MKSRIVALALIGIMLSSTGVNVADGFTIAFSVTEINSVPQIEIDEKNELYLLKN